MHVAVVLSQAFRRRVNEVLLTEESSRPPEAVRSLHPWYSVRLVNIRSHFGHVQGNPVLRPVGDMSIDLAQK